ncbi:hypothetical protein WJX74_000213 [Apatococcus lobatus]|uniref:Uncharacterized protein n=1 Tax=Apatococcus lobatus TaxID=904363 RepID=A0AAW1QK29_9CHLO
MEYLSKGMCFGNMGGSCSIQPGIVRPMWQQGQHRMYDSSARDVSVECEGKMKPHSCLKAAMPAGGFKSSEQASPLTKLHQAAQKDCNKNGERGSS